MLPKKNFKSGLAASIMLTMLVRNWRNSAEFTILAPTVEVASNSFTPAKDMCLYVDPTDEEDNPLNDLIHVQTHIKTLTHREKGALLKVVAADPSSVAGKKSVGTLIEELWLWGKLPKAKDMLREAKGGLASRPEGFIIYITTQSDEPPAGVFKEKLDYARDVRDGKVHDPQFLPIIYEHPPEMIASEEHLLVENLAMVNPNLGYSVDEAYLEREHRVAEVEGRESLNGFLSKHGNVEIGMNLRNDRWPGADHWEAHGKASTLEELLSRSEVVTIGIDGGGLDDLLGFGAMGRDTGTGQWLHWGRAWAHPTVLKRRKDIAPRLMDFAAQGDLVIVKRLGEDTAELAKICKQIADSGLLPEEGGIGVDPAGINFEEDLAAEGIGEENLIGVSQGWKLGGTIKTVERGLAQGVITHSAQPMMAWAVSNARVEKRGNSVLITKQISGSAKIDPLSALLNAAHLMALNPQPRLKSYQLMVFG